VLSRRLFSAALLLGVVFCLIGLDVSRPVFGQPGIWMIPLYWALGLGTCWEASSLLSKKWPVTPTHTIIHAFIASTVAMFPIWYSLAQGVDYPSDCPVGKLGWILIGVLTGIGTAGAHALVSLQMPLRVPQSDREISKVTDLFERTTLGWCLSSFIISYVISCMSFWFLVRLHWEKDQQPLQGMLTLVGMLAIVKFADVGAYFVGKTFGKHKLAPNLSPGKTWEGLVGGMVSSVLVAYVLLRLVLPRLGLESGASWWGPALLGCLLTIVGLVGDLLESMIKRSVGAKDSGALLPGLGGVWDVTDSLLPTAIVGYLGIIAKLH
jgi:phosphatidate cytidylyltransferase